MLTGRCHHLTWIVRRTPGPIKSTLWCVGWRPAVCSTPLNSIFQYSLLYWWSNHFKNVVLITHLLISTCHYLSFVWDLQTILCLLASEILIYIFKIMTQSSVIIVARSLLLLAPVRNEFCDSMWLVGHGMGMFNTRVVLFTVSHKPTAFLWSRKQGQLASYCPISPWIVLDILLNWRSFCKVM